MSDSSIISNQGRMSSEIHLQVDALMAFLPSEGDFERMSGEGMYEISYNEFLKSNRYKIGQLDSKYRSWLMSLMKMISSEHITMMDKEYCIPWHADGFFFDKDGKLCLTHAR